MCPSPRSLFLDTGPTGGTGSLIGSEDIKYLLRSSTPRVGLRSGVVRSYSLVHSLSPSGVTTVDSGTGSGRGR